MYTKSEMLSYVIKVPYSCISILLETISEIVNGVVAGDMPGLLLFSFVNKNCEAKAPQHKFIIK